MDKELKNVIHTPISPNFVYPDIKPSDFKFGSATEVEGVILREDGDWRPYVPDEEYQNIRGIESSACYIEGQNHAIATIQEEQFDLPNKNYSARFNAYLSEGTPNGGSPIKGADSIRHDGLIDDGMLPFSDEITSWDDFHSFKGANEAECRLQGKLWLEEWEPKYDIVVERSDSIQEKYKKLRRSLKSGPVPMSCAAWWEKDGVYIKPEGMRDNHMVECVYLDENNCAYVWDTYSPFLKKLAPFYDFEFGMRWSLKRLEKKPVITPEVEKPVEKPAYNFPSENLPKKKENWFVDIIKNVWEFLKDILRTK